MNSFRPLSGSYISQSPEQFCQYISDRFRPLSGSYISQCSESFNPEVITFCFRPLSGSYISQSSTHHSAILHYRFPSPIGELHFSIVRNAYWTKKTISVSVPYRGATFLNDVRLRGYDKRTEVSVPYRGATFLNHQWITHPRRMTQFPSPIGELHFSMMCISDVILYRICPSFRPLSGSYISQWDGWTLSSGICFCFRPLSGSYISQCRCYLLPRSNNRFPSPIGELHFSIYTDLAYEYVMGQQVSVPYRGATFLNQLA